MSFPHETLPICRLSLADFCNEAARLADTRRPLPANAEPQLRKFHVANLVIGGRLLHEDGTTSRVFVDDPAKHPISAPNAPDLGKKFYGEMIGEFKTLNLRTDLRVYTIPLSHERMENNGALAKMRRPFELFAGGKIGSGRQWLSWIHIDDVVAAYVAAASDERYRGSFNLVTD